MSLPDRIQRGDYYLYTFDGHGLIKAPAPTVWRTPVEVQTVADYVNVVDADLAAALVGLTLTPPYDHTSFYWSQKLTDPDTGRQVPGEMCVDVTMQTIEQARDEVTYRRSVASRALQTPITVPDELESFLDTHTEARWILHGSLIVATPGRFATHIPFGLNVALDETGGVHRPLR